MVGSRYVEHTVRDGIKGSQLQKSFVYLIVSEKLKQIFSSSYTSKRNATLEYTNYNGVLRTR